MAVTLVAMAAGIVGLLELARMLTGQSEVGDWLREVRQ
jgi:hypothetical protein